MAHVRSTVGDAGDHESTVGVTDEDDRAVQSVDGVGHDDRIVGEARERQIGGHDLVTELGESGGDRFPTPATVAEAVDEYER